MSAIQQLLTDHINIWMAADTEKRSGRGRASSNAGSVYGIRKLRELILELAVRGKLVPQDPKDEPASELLKHIQKEKEKLISGGKIKKENILPKINKKETLCELPKGWEWTTLADISLVNPRNDAQDNLPVSFVPMTMIGTTFASPHDHEPRLWKDIKQGFTHFAEGDIGVAKITPCFENSKACVFSGLLNGIGAGTTELHIVRPLASTLVPRYVLAYLKSPQFLLVGETKMTGTAGQKRLPKDFVESNPFPLPPLAEQHRIVAKVDELMALCDQLESKHNNAAEAHEKIVRVLLDSLTQSADAKDFANNWQRIAAHFDTLFTTEQSIDALKQTLLQLAVMGKLVPQDPKDESASELLKHIQKEKEKLIAAGKINKDKPLLPITDEEKPFELPSGWEWVTLYGLLDASRDISYGVIKLGNEPKNGGVNVLRCSDVKPGYVNLTGVRRVSEEIEREYFRTRLVGGEILLNIRGTLGGVALARSNLKGYNVAREIAVIPIFSDLSGEYIVNVMRSIYFWNAILDGLRGIAYKGLNLGALRLFPIPLPPISEQRRIVAKVDELMALCDQLKTRITEANQLQQKLADVMVERAVA